MHDIDIRHTLLSLFGSLYGDSSDALVVEELGLCQGESRIDVAVINGSIHGYEIKSERDTLDRLPIQQNYYNRTLDYVTIVSAEKHIPEIKNMVPHWWGIQIARYSSDNVVIEDFRSAKKNPDLDPGALVQLLWRDEAISALRERGLQKGVLGKPRTVAWERLVDRLSIEELKQVVRDCLKSRSGWRLDQQQA